MFEEQFVQAKKRDSPSPFHFRSSRVTRDSKTSNPFVGNSEELFQLQHYSCQVQFQFELALQTLLLLLLQMWL